MSKFKIGDKVRIAVDWAKPGRVKTAIARIIGFQRNGGSEFARVKWQGNDAVILDEEYGNLFAQEELRSA